MIGWQEKSILQKFVIGIYSLSTHNSFVAAINSAVVQQLLVLAVMLCTAMKHLPMIYCVK